jgi:serine/threonine-protein kinase
MSIEGSYFFPDSWSPDGQVLVFSELHPSTKSWDISMLVRGAGRKPFLRTQFSERSAALYPDGRWLAYESNESGRYEIYVRPFPGPGRMWQLSTEGGVEPVWGRSGRELFYREGDKMMAVEVTTHPAFTQGKPKLLFQAYHPAVGPTASTYDLTPDGQRFITIKEREWETGPTQINVVPNWFDDLLRRVPIKKR